MNDNVRQLASAQDVPIQSPSNGNGNGGGRDTTKIVERLAKLETHLQYTAKKEDIEKMQSTMLRWQIGILITVVIASCFATASLIM